VHVTCHKRRAGNGLQREHRQRGGIQPSGQDQSALLRYGRAQQGCAAVGWAVGCQAQQHDLRAEAGQRRLRDDNAAKRNTQQTCACMTRLEQEAGQVS
jgi:hypothetical protein